MRCKGRHLLTLFFAAVAAYAVLSAMHWRFKAALFPLVMGIPLLLLSLTQLLLDLRGRAETAADSTMDLELSADVPEDVARRRTLTIFAWIAGFILLVLLASFPIAVPLFMAAYLTLQSRAHWLVSLALTAAAWGFFYGLFQWLLRMQFEEGLIQMWLGV